MADEIKGNKDKIKRTIHPNSLANLKPAKPGEVRNPTGRPKDPGITKSQIGMLDKPCPYAKDPKTTWRMWLAEKGLILATQKEMALEHLKERLEGKVTQPTDGKVTIEWVYKDRKEADD